MKEFNLSSKWMESFGTIWFKQEDIKEVVKRLKDDFCTDGEIPDECMCPQCHVINQIFGERFK